MMTSVLAGAYPDVFAAGVVDSGVAYGCFALPGQPDDSWNSQCSTGTLIKTGAQWVRYLRAHHQQRLTRSTGCTGQDWLPWLHRRVPQDAGVARHGVRPHSQEPVSKASQLMGTLVTLLSTLRTSLRRSRSGRPSSTTPRHRSRTSASLTFLQDTRTRRTARASRPSSHRVSDIPSRPLSSSTLSSWALHRRMVVGETSRAVRRDGRLKMTQA